MRNTKSVVAFLLLWLLSTLHPQRAMANDWCPEFTTWWNLCQSEEAENLYTGPGGYWVDSCYVYEVVDHPTAELPQTDYFIDWSVYEDATAGYHDFKPGWDAACFYSGSPGGNPSTQPLNSAANNGMPICCNIVGDPINAGTGNVFRKEDDFAVGRWLTFSRYYNSNSSVTNDVMGQHWRHTYSRSLTYSPGTIPKVTVNQEDGRTTTWIETGTSPIAWGTTPDISDDLKETVDSNGNPTGWTIYRSKLKSLEQYSASGQLITIQDSGGFTTTFQYSTATTPTSIAPSPGLLISATDASGRTLAFIYNGSGQLSQVNLPGGETYSYGYDGSGELYQVTFPDGSTRHYLYNEPAELNGSTASTLLTGIIDETGNRFETYAYDSNNRAISNQQTGGAGLVNITYGANSQATVIDALGNTTIRSFSLMDGVMRESATSGPCLGCSNVSSYTRDLRGNVSSSTDFNGNTALYGYDMDNFQVTQEQAVGTSLQRTLAQSWDSTLHVLTGMNVQDANNNVLSKSTWVYNASGEPLTQCLYDGTLAAALGYKCGSATSAPTGVRQWTLTYCTSTGTNCPLVGLLLTETGPRTDLTQTSSYTYFPNGDIKSVTDPMGHTETILTYDADGRIKTVQDANGITTSLTYTPRGWLASTNIGGATTIYGYTPYGSIQSITDPDGVTTTYGYDTAHRLNKITDDLGNYIVYTLDAAGNKTAEQTFDSSGTLHRSLSRTFNNLGELVKVVDGIGNTTFNATSTGSYDGNGNLVLSTDGFGTARQMSYDALNRLTQIVDNYNGSDTATQNTKTIYGYDSLSRLSQVTDPIGLSTTYTYNGLNDPTVQTSPDTGNTVRTYDAAGNILSVTDAKGVVATNSYDTLNRLLKTTYSDATQNITYSYDDSNSTTSCSNSYPVGRLTRIIEYSVTTIYCYDPRGNIIETQQVTTQGTDVTSYAISLAGRIDAITYPTGTTVTYARDGDGRIVSVTVAPLGGAASQVANNVTYLPFGPVNSYTLGNGQTVSRTYDANYRLTDLVSPAFSIHLARDLMGNPIALGNSPGANPALEVYGIDPLYRVTSVTGSSGANLESVTYNQAGDRLTESGMGLATGTYSYSPNTHRLVGIGSSARTVDANGNTTAISSSAGTFGFGYSARNRMTVVQLGGNTIATYTYNALGQRIQKLVSGAIDRFDYNERGQIIGEYNATNRDYVWLDNIPIANVDSSGTTSAITYVTADHLNTPRAISNGTGATIWQWTYQDNVWGEQAATSSSYTYNLQFPGQYFDAESGLSNNYFRDYDATSGRYVESDPLGLAGGISTYTYAESNSLRHRDRLGLSDFGDMQGAFCPGGLCTLPPDMVQNSWGAPNMAPVYLMDSAALLASGGTILAEDGVAGLLRWAYLATAVNGAVDLPPAAVATSTASEVATEAAEQKELSDMFEKIIDDFVTEPTPPPQEVPTEPQASPLIVPTGNQDPCPK